MRLIDADYLYELLDEGFDIDLNELPETKAELLRMIEDAPTVDPIPHGHFGHIQFGVGTCSVCGRSCMDAYKWEYCPHCGAKIDEKFLAGEKF